MVTTVSDEADELELIPRAVRDKLDRVGIKLHLHEWIQLAHAERFQLRDLSCDTPAAIAHYRTTVVDLVRRYTGADPTPLEPK